MTEFEVYLLFLYVIAIAAGAYYVRLAFLVFPKSRCFFGCHSWVINCHYDDYKFCERCHKKVSLK